MYLSKAYHCASTQIHRAQEKKNMDGPASPGPNNRLYHWGPWWTIPSYACLINKHASGQGYVKLCESNSEEIYRALCAGVFLSLATMHLYNIQVVWNQFHS